MSSHRAKNHQLTEENITQTDIHQAYAVVENVQGWQKGHKGNLPQTEDDWNRLLGRILAQAKKDGVAFTDPLEKEVRRTLRELNKEGTEKSGKYQFYEELFGYEKNSAALQNELGKEGDGHKVASPRRVNPAAMTPAPQTRGLVANRSRAKLSQDEYKAMMISKFRYSGKSEFTSHIAYIWECIGANLRFREVFAKFRVGKDAGIRVTINYTKEKGGKIVKQDTKQVVYYESDNERALRITKTLLDNSHWYEKGRRYRDKKHIVDSDFTRRFRPHVLGTPLLQWVKKEDLGQRSILEKHAIVAIDGNDYDIREDEGFRQVLLAASRGNKAVDRWLDKVINKTLERIEEAKAAGKELSPELLRISALKLERAGPVNDNEPNKEGGRKRVAGNFRLDVNKSLLEQGYALEASYETLLGRITKTGIPAANLSVSIRKFPALKAKGYQYGLKRGDLGGLTVITQAMKDAFDGEVPATFAYGKLNLGGSRRDRIHTRNQAGLSTFDIIKTAGGAEYDPHFQTKANRAAHVASLNTNKPRKPRINYPISDVTYSHKHVKSILSLNAFTSTRKVLSEKQQGQLAVLDDADARSIMLRESRFIRSIRNLGKVDELGPITKSRRRNVPVTEAVKRR